MSVTNYNTKLELLIGNTLAVPVAIIIIVYKIKCMWWHDGTIQTMTVCPYFCFGHVAIKYSFCIEYWCTL